MKKKVALTVVAIVICSVLVAIFVLSRKSSQAQSTTQTQQVDPNAPLVYKNTLYEFSFLHSANTVYRDTDTNVSFIKLSGVIVDKSLAETLLNEGGFPSVEIEVIQLSGSSMYNWISSRMVNDVSELTPDLQAEKGIIYVSKGKTINKLSLNGDPVAVYTINTYLGDFTYVAVQHGDNMFVFSGVKMDFAELVASVSFNSEPTVNTALLKSLNELEIK